MFISCEHCLTHRDAPLPRNVLTLASTNCAQTLQVPRSATPKQIKRAYRHLALKLHPDKVGENATMEQRDAFINVCGWAWCSSVMAACTSSLLPAPSFLQVARAYEILSDPEQRASYDKNGEVGIAVDASDPLLPQAPPTASPTLASSAPHCNSNRVPYYFHAR